MTAITDVEHHLMTEAVRKIEELRREKAQLLAIIHHMAEADIDCDSYAVQAYAKEALK